MSWYIIFHLNIYHVLGVYVLQYGLILKHNKLTYRQDGQDGEVGISAFAFAAANRSKISTD